MDMGPPVWDKRDFPQLLQNRALSFGRMCPQYVHSFTTKPLLYLEEQGKDLYDQVFPTLRYSTRDISSSCIANQYGLSKARLFQLYKHFTLVRGFDGQLV